jgi:hypothetical protein
MDAGVSGSTLVGMIAGVAVAAMLTVSGFYHVRNLSHFGDELATHDFLPWNPRSWATVIAASEIVLGAAGVLALWSPQVGSSAFALSALLFSAFGLYLMGLMRWKPGLPCACDDSGSPANLWTVARGWAFALLSVTAARWAPARIVASPELALGLSAGLALAAVARLLPPAMSVPSALPVQASVLGDTHRGRREEG